MRDPITAGGGVAFGPYWIDRQQRLLFRDGHLVALEPKVFDTLLVLVEADGTLVSKDELLQKIWPGTFVEEGSVTRNVSTLRRILGKNADDQQYIATVPKRGYRLVATVRNAIAEQPRQSAVAPAIGGPALTRRRVAAAAIAVLFVAGSIVAATMARGPRTAPPGRQALAVLPFVNFGEAKDEYFSDGLTEELTSALSGVPSLQVVARRSAFTFKNKAVDVHEIGRLLHVGTLVEGSVRRQGNRLRITVQLNNAESGYQYWSRTWDRTLEDVFAIQQEIAEQVSLSLQSGSVAARPVVHPPTTNLEAYNLYLEGRFYGSRTMFAKAHSLLAAALQKEPDFPDASTALAGMVVVSGYIGETAPRQAYPEAQALLAQVIAIDPQLPSVPAIQGWISTFYDWDWRRGENELKRAIAVAPYSAESHHAYSHFLVAMGRFDESLMESRRAIELDPLDPSKRGHLAWHYLMVRDPERAVRETHAGLELDPRSPDTLFYEQWAQEDRGDFKKALDAMARRGMPDALVSRARAEFGRRGPQGYWEAVRESELERAAYQYINVRTIVNACARLGRTAEALDWLERGFRERDSWLAYLKTDPAYDSLRDEPRFNALVKHVGLP
jgi:TolB-like protein/DNA-binding winged helix-turn-helix (wHTH) protein